METSNAEITTLAELGAADAKPDDAKSGDSAPPVKVADTSEDTSSWTEKAQKRYDELTRKAYEAEGARDRERYQRESLQAQLAELQKAKTEPVAPEQFPTLEQFGFDEAKYQAAVIAHISDLAKMQGKTAAAEALKEERERQQSEKAGQSWAQREAELIKSKPDYVDKVQNATTLPISKDLQGVLKGHSQGPQIALYLVDNSDAASAIMRLPLAEQLIEVGRIAGKMEAAKVPPKPAVSQAPPPVNKVDTTESSADKAPEDMIGSTPTQFAKWRKKYMK